jgi:hypothetical protein
LAEKQQQEHTLFRVMEVISKIKGKKGTLLESDGFVEQKQTGRSYFIISLYILLHCVLALSDI